MSLISLFFFLTLTGCSTSLFTGDTKSDLQVGDGNFNKECLGLDLSQEKLSVGTTRNLLSCLNANGSIQGYVDYANALSDSELGVLVEFANEQLVKNQSRLQAMDRSFEQMDKAGTIDEVLSSLQPVFENEEFLLSLLALIKNTAYPLSSNLLNALEILGAELSSEHVSRLLEISARASKLPSYKKLVHAFNPKTSSKFGLEFYVTQSLDYLQRRIKDKTSSPAKQALWGLYDGTLFKALDFFYYESKEDGKIVSIENQIRSLESLIHFLFVEQKDLLPSIQKLFHQMNGPIYCLENTKKIPNADLFVLEEFTKRDPLEVPKWVVSSNILTMQVANGVCSFPPKFNELMSALRTLAIKGNHRPLVTVAQLAHGLKVGDQIPIGNGSEDLRKQIIEDLNFSIEHEKERYRRLYIDLLAHPDSIDYLGEVIAELSKKERNFFGNFFYLTNGFNDKDRKSLQYVLGVILKKRAKLSNESIFDVLKPLILQINAKDLTKLLKNLESFLSLEKPILEPLLTSHRKALLSNNLNPGLESLRELLENANQHKLFLNTLVEILARPELRNAISLTSKMASNGSLKELLKGLLVLFRKGNVSLPSQNQVAEVASPEQTGSIDSSLPWSFKSPIWNSKLSACHEVDLNYNLNYPFQSLNKWAKQVRALGKCIEASIGAKNTNVSEFVDYGLEKNLSNGKPFLPAVAEVSTDFILNQNKEVLNEIGGFLTDSRKFEKVLKLSELLKFSLKKEYCLDEQCSSGRHILARDLGDLLAYTFEEKTLTSLEITNSFLAKLAAKQNGPKLLSYHYKLLKQAKEMPPTQWGFKPPVFSYPIHLFPKNSKLIDELIEAMRVYESIPPDHEEYERKLTEKIHHFWNNVQAGQNWDKYSNAEHFKSELKPLLDKLAQPKMIESLLSFFFYMDASPYCAEWWESWLKRLSANVTVIPYYYPGTYPGKDKPSVRLVSQLDLLELIVIDSNYSLRELGQDDWLTWLAKFGSLDENFAVKYLSKLAQLPPDVDMNQWIDEMSEELGDFTKYLPPHPASTTLGLMRPEVARRLFNLDKVIPVLRFFNKVTEAKCADGRIARGNDLGFLRDLFKAILKATPKEKWNDWDRTNSLVLIADVSKMGLTRNIGINMWNYDPRNPDPNKQITYNPIAKIIQPFVEAAIERTHSGHRLNKDNLKMLSYFLREDCDRSMNQSCSAIKDFDKRYVTISKLIDKGFEWVEGDQCDQEGTKIEVYKHNFNVAERPTQCRLAAFKKLGYYAGTLLGELESKSPGFVKRLIHAAQPVICENASLLSNHLDKLDPLAKSTYLANYLESFVKRESDSKKETLTFANDTLTLLQPEQDQVLRHLAIITRHLLEDPKKRAEFLFKTLDQINNDPEFKELGLSELSDQLVDWLGRETPLGQRARRHFAAHLENQNFLELLKFIGAESKQNEFYEKVHFLGDPRYIQDIQSFMFTLRAGIQDN